MVLKLTISATLLAVTCVSPANQRRPPAVRTGRTAPGITVLLEDSIGVVRGKRIGLLTNQTGVDRSGRSDADLLLHGDRALAAGVRLVSLFSPEHGIRGTEDREHLASGRDSATGLPLYSLYGATTEAPPDSAMGGLDALVVDLQDVGTRTWTYVAATVYAMRSAARHQVRVIVLDRPNPLTGVHVEGPVLDSALANADTDVPGRPARPYALAPIPLRHGLTMGELALFYNDALGIRADLHVIPARGWRRALWFDQTGLPWVQPSPGLPTLESTLLYPALVAFESSNLSVGRGTDAPFQRVGAPWLDARRVVALLQDRSLVGVQFAPESFTPTAPTDRKYAGQRLSGVRITVTDRDGVSVARVGAALVWAIAKIHPDSLRLDTLGFDLRFGSSADRRALVRGEDPDAIIDREAPATVSFERRTRPYTLYR